MGVANCAAALDAGVRTLDASIAGLGGCPYSPGYVSIPIAWPSPLSRSRGRPEASRRRTCSICSPGRSIPRPRLLVQLTRKRGLRSSRMWAGGSRASSGASRRVASARRCALDASGRSRRSSPSRNYECASCRVLDPQVYSIVTTITDGVWSSARDVRWYHGATGGPGVVC
jgi:hypothetical protein